MNEDSPVVAARLMARAIQRFRERLVGEFDAAAAHSPRRSPLRPDPMPKKLCTDFAQEQNIALKGGGSGVSIDSMGRVVRATVVF